MNKFCSCFPYLQKNRSKVSDDETSTHNGENNTIERVIKIYNNVPDISNNIAKPILQNNNVPDNHIDQPGNLLSLKTILNLSVDKVSCVYLFRLGTVGDLRVKMKINEGYVDESIVVKFGRTNDLVRRSKEHEKLYNEITGVDIKLYKYLCIDQEYTVDAENQLKKFFEDNMVNYKSFKEIAILPKNQEKFLNQCLTHVKETCGNRVKFLQCEIEQLKKEILLKNDTISVIKGSNKDTIVHNLGTEPVHTTGKGGKQD